MDSDEKIFVQTCTNLQFRRLLLLCFWRDGRRACVAELYSSYRTHQELCKIQQRTVPWTNPFASFLRSAHAAYQNIPWQPEISTDPSILSSFMRVSEERRFVFDMVDRVEAVVVTFDRLRELCKMYLRSQKTIDVVVEKQRSANPSRNVFEVPEKEMKKCDRCRWESYGLALFACYEMSTFVGLGKVSPRVDSHLEYLVGVRNKILVHPRRDGFVKNSSSVWRQLLFPAGDNYFSRSTTITSLIL